MRSITLLIYFCIAIIIAPFSYAAKDTASSYLEENRLADQLRKTYKDDLFYDKVCWLTSHNSYAYYHPSFKRSSRFIPNQMRTIKEQLEYGVRSFMIDLHDDEGNVIIAHLPDLPEFIRYYFFIQSFSKFLETIEDWLDKHKEDIITIHLESYVRDYNKIAEIIHNSELENYLFDLKSSKDWPTLGEMRKTNKRLVIFSDKKKDVGFGIMHTSKYMETEYNLAQFPNCEKRSDNRAKESSLLVMNHFYEGIGGIPVIPHKVYINTKGYKLTDKAGIKNIVTINSYEEISKRVCDCFKQEGQWPNFIAFDYVGSNEEEINSVIKINTNKIDCTDLFTAADHVPVEPFLEEVEQHDEL